MNPRNTLICTVGTSFFGNMMRLVEKTADKPERWMLIHDAYEQKNWKLLAQEMLQLAPSERVCGAEINTIEEVRGKNWLSMENLFFLVSDTPEGNETGIFLRHYFGERHDLALRNLEIVRVEHLQDQEPKRFKAQGLRNLVRCIGDIAQRVGGPQTIAIDATGGYKAQIAVAVIVGQALNVPVFYKHERFSEIIDFPPLPISFDYDVLGEYADLLTDFERGQALTTVDIGTVDEKLRVLLVEVDLDGQMMYELSPIGQIYLMGFRLRNPKPVNLKPSDAKREPSFRDDHFPLGFEEYVKRIWRDTSWVVSTHTLPYDRQRSIKGNGFYLFDGKLVGTYLDRNNFGARFELLLTDSTVNALIWAADFLNQKYRD